MDFPDSTSFMILGALFLFFAFFSKHAISVLGLVLIYIGYTKMQMNTQMFYLIMLWVLLAILYDFKVHFGLSGDFLLF
jgi:hypothetical protein